MYIYTFETLQSCPRKGNTVPHSTAFCPLVDPSDVVNSSLRVLTLCLAAKVVPCEQLCVCIYFIH